MKPHPKIVCVFLTFLIFACDAQSLLSAGIRNAMGISPMRLHATLTANNLVTEIKPTIHLLHGVVLQYVIGNKFGVESGLQAVLYSYGQKGGTFFFSNDIWFANFQVPLLFFFKKDH